MVKIINWKNIISFSLIISLLFIIGCSYVDIEENDHDDVTENFELSVHDFADQIEQNSNAYLIDVRQLEEYVEKHITNSFLLPLDQISQSSVEELGIDKDDEILLYCRSGSRSAQAYDLLIALGYTNVKSLQGGIIHWVEDGFSVESGGYVEPTTVEEETEKESLGPVASISSSEYGFGQILATDGIISTTFDLRNDGDEDLNILSLSSSCGCTTAEIQDEVILPGESTTITVYFNPNYHAEPEGKFSRTVFVETDDPNNSELEFRISVEFI
jgi:phage shock protein E